MDVPGGNWLSLALTVIGSQTVQFFKEAARVNNKGLWLVTYADALEYDEGSVQPVDKRLYQALNLDFQKNYVSWFVPDNDAVNIARDQSGSVFEWNGRRFQMVGQTDWFAQDSWSAFIGCDIGPATGALTNA